MALVPSGYRPRLLDKVIARRLKGFGAVEVAGTKFCGKTWASLAQGESITHIDDGAVRRAVEVDVGLALAGAQPHVIDEWQDVPQIWDAVRRAIDETGNKHGQYLLTGSSSADKTKVSHSGAGRIAKIHLRPLSLFESGLSEGSVSLAGLFDGECPAAPSSASALGLAEAVCLGGWPASLGAAPDEAASLPGQYLESLFEVSARKVGLDPTIAQRVAESLARNLGKALTYKTIYADAFQEELDPRADASVFRKPLDPYLAFFKDQYFVEEQHGWDAPVKSRSRVRSKPKRGFADPSLGAALLSMAPERLVMETQTFGTLFEEMCLRDVRVYASALDLDRSPKVLYYGDADGLEVDIVVELPDGRWGAFEVKLGDAKVSQAERSLLRLRDKVAANPAARNPEPSFLAVLVGVTPFARRLPSGVCVVPITSLGA